jgi:hypothetical protein
MKNIEEMCVHELIALQHKISERIKLLIQIDSQEKMLNFEYGDKVTFKNYEGKTIVGIIERFNKKSVTILDDQGLGWRVSPQLVQKINIHLIENVSFS